MYLLGSIVMDIHVENGLNEHILHLTIVFSALQAFFLNNSGR